MTAGASAFRILVALGLLLLVLGAKLWVVDMAGTSVPYRDQIDAEGESILRPWAEGRLEMRSFFEPHNEHHIVFTKLLTWLGVAINGQWDAYVQVVTNALLHGLLLLFVLQWLGGQIRGWRLAMVGTLATCAFVLPLDWENTLGGFQSQVYLVLIFSFLHLRGVLESTPYSRRWLGGQLCGLLALGAMASGVFSSIAVLIVTASAAARQRRVDRHALVTAGVCVLWVLIAWITRNPVPGHDILRATSLSQFFNAIGMVLTWPWQSLSPWSLVLALPAFIGVGLAIRRENELSAQTKLWLGLMVWMGMTIVATAWLRGQGSPLISRYLTNYVFLIILQGLVLIVVRKSLVMSLVAMGYAAVAVLGLFMATQPVIQTRLPGIADRNQSQNTILREYFASSDEAVLRDADPKHLPYPSADVLVERWKHQSIQKLMPAAVRRPLSLGPVAETSGLDLPPPPHPLLVSSPLAPQTHSWTWRSDRQPATAAPILRFRFLGALGDPEAAISLRICTDEDSWEVVPDGPARNRWKTINVMRPAGEWWLEIEDSDSLDQIALTKPVELGWLSWGAEKLIKFHFWWLSVGLFMIGMGLLGQTGQWWRQEKSPP